MPQFFIERTIEPGDEVEIRGAEAKHIAGSLRLTKGDWLVLTAGDGRSFVSEIAASSTKLVVAHVAKELPQRSIETAPVLAQAIIKHDRTEWIIQKAVELGVARIIPFSSARTIPQYADSVGERRHRRWQKIALEAAKQSGLPFRPQIEAPIAFSDLAKRFADFENPIIFWEGERERSLKSIFDKPKSTIVVIGPEGGFSSDEITHARESGAVTASLGEQIFKVETAAISALAICQYELGNFSIKKA